jgi:hypothetical protein
MNSRTFTTIDNKYVVTSYGNGWAYEVRCKQTDYAFFLQDHDADELQKMTNDFEDTYALEEYMSVMGTPDRELDIELTSCSMPTTELTEEEKWNRAFEYIKNQAYQDVNEAI